MANILIVDDDGAFREGLAETLRDLGHEAHQADSGTSALVQIEHEASCTAFDLIFLDLRLRGMDGMETLRELRKISGCENLPVVVLTAFADSDNTIEAMKLGAFDHLTKRIGREEVRAVLTRALARPRIQRSADPSAKVLEADDRLLGSSPEMREVHKLIGLAAPSDATVLVQGETGTGKRRSRARAPGVGGGQLRGDSCGAARKRALWSRARRLYRRVQSTCRQVQGSRSRHAFPR